MASDLTDWYKSIPEMTRYWFTGCTVLPLLGRLGIFSPYTMLLDWNLFFSKFQVSFLSLEQIDMGDLDLEANNCIILLSCDATDGFSLVINAIFLVQLLKKFGIRGI